MIGAPPVIAGETHDKITEPLPELATSPVAAPAFAAGTTGTPALEEPVPAAFTALTRYRYVVPFVRSVSLNVKASIFVAMPVHVTPPSLERSML